MRENFDLQLSKIAKYQKRHSSNSVKASELLDDMATAFISAKEYGHLDESLKAVKSTRKLLLSQGYSRQEINDYFLQHSYISKTRIRKLRIESIDDTESNTIIADTRSALFNSHTTTDRIINSLKARPELLSALQQGIDKRRLSDTFHISSPVLLQHFYAKYKDIIND